MVLNFYKLREQPFGVTPDSRYLYLSPTHREALASVVYALTSGRGFSALIAKPGMGKTTILFNFLSMMRDHAKTVFLFQSQTSPRDLLRSLLADMGIEDDGTDMVRLHSKLNECLLNESRRGRRLIVVIDEAQNLEDPVLEVVRMLSNFETSQEKLMHFILAGQPQLADKLASPRLLQLKQRIAIFARLSPFTAEETQLYIDHRLRVAGYDFEKPFFTKQAQKAIASYSQGIPRNINNICFNAMSIGYVAKQKSIDVDVIREVMADLDLRPLLPEPEIATKAEEPNEAAKALVSHGLSRSRLQSWSLRLGFALLVVVATVSGLLVRAKQQAPNELVSTTSQITKESAVTTDRIPAPSSQEPPAIPESDVKLASPDGSRIVVVPPNETLYQIILSRFGKYEEQTLAKVRELNPWLTDARRIKAGQKIRVPNTVRRIPEAADGEREKQ
ncbi:MAG: AAA family ATPase [Candidatus Acidiferrum sp.]